MDTLTVATVDAYADVTASAMRQSRVFQQQTNVKPTDTHVECNHVGNFNY